VLEAGVSFLEKPYRPVELALKVREVLDAEAREAISGVKEVVSEIEIDRTTGVR
jgi:DNA-binding response OmpR family regulator